MTAAVDGAPPATPARAPCPPRILVLDDDPFMLGVQALMLRSMGYPEVVTATRSEAALATLQSAPRAVDVIVCDLNMPGMDGIAFLQHLNASAFHGSAILLSGEGFHIMHSVRKLLAGGRLSILGALEKPATRAGLTELLGRWRPRAAERAVPPPPITAAELHEASRAGQWMLHYQPQVSLRGGAIVGVEALIRWNHPTHGLVFPDHFVSAAEDCGAIDALTDWVLQEGTAQLARWQAEGLALKVAINVSMENLRSPDFAQRVQERVEKAGVAPRDVTLELTESRLMSPTPTPLESLVRLRLQRHGLSLDDFGTGHSTLAQLRDVPFTDLKIDRSFVHGARHDQIIRPMLEGSIAIARGLGMTSVAEGVETADDWQFLRELGCDQAQGYFIARPMAADRLPAWAADWRARCSGLFGG